MKKNIFKSAVISGAVCMSLVVPVFAQDTSLRPIFTEGIETIPISYEFDHWAEPYLDQLSQRYETGSVFDIDDFNAVITIEDFQKLIKLTIDEEYDSAPDAITREAIVYELAKIWAEKTGKVLDEIPVIKMLIYSDTGEIDSKYNHGITVAYMRDIAKGRDTGNFDPKADVTYGELATLIANTDKAIRDEMESENQPVIEGKFETKGNYKIQDDKVVFDFELVNHYTEAKELEFSSGQQFEITITDEKGDEVYKYSDDKFFTMALLFKSINPGESLRWQNEWDMTNKKGEKLISGKYQAKISVIAAGKDSQKIEESQLTTMIDFSL